MKKSPQPGTHVARIMRFADADTAVVLIKGDFGVWVERYLRLKGIESYELDGPDRAKAQGIRTLLNEALGGRDCLVHLTSHGHDRYGRLRGQITVGEHDLAESLIERGHAWPCTAEESANMHAGRQPHAPTRGDTPCKIDTSQSPSPQPSSHLAQAAPC